MRELDDFIIDLKAIKTEVVNYNFRLDDSFFAQINGEEVQRGEVAVLLSICKKNQSFELSFHSEGFVIIPCDRCLDDMEQSIISENIIKVKFGEEYSENENMIVVPENEGTINLTWLLYEIVALAIPIKHVHREGECNKLMLDKLEKHLVKSSDDGEDEGVEENSKEKPIDPRWNDLKKIIDNN